MGHGKTTIGIVQWYSRIYSLDLPLLLLLLLVVVIFVIFYFQELFYLISLFGKTEKIGVNIKIQYCFSKRAFIRSSETVVPNS